MADQGMGITLSEVSEFLRGRVLSGQGAAAFSRVVTDSRTGREGDLFVALRGDRFDGHGFVEEALQKGASGVLVQEPVSEQIFERYKPAVVQVPDTLKALGDLAAGWRKRFSTPVGVLTGSNGKTTTKELILSILRQDFSCLCSPGNYNNRIGLPLTLLELGDEHERVILEMGMNEPGEIRELTRISMPQAGLLLNIGPAHLGNFPSMDALARAKAEMLEKMPPDSVFVFNQDDPRVREIALGWKGPKRSFGFHAGCDIALLDTEKSGVGQRLRVRIPGEEISTEIRIPGMHNLYNVLAAIALAHTLGASRDAIQAGPALFKGVSGRFVTRQRDRFTIVDDSYNANPRSMQAALETFSELSGDAARILVLGDMLELGRFSEEAHQDLGKRAAGIDPALLCVKGGFAEWVRKGALQGGCAPERVHLFEEPEDAAAKIQGAIRGGEWILVKGSRGMALERVVRALEEGSGQAEDKDKGS